MRPNAPRVAVPRHRPRARRPRGGHAFVVLAAAVATLVLGRPASADEPRGRAYWGGSLGLHVAYLAHEPSLVYSPETGDLGVDKNPVTSTAGVVGLGFDLDFFAATGTPLFVPMIGARLGAFFNTSRTQTSSTGSTFSLDSPSTASLELPGLGVRLLRDRYAFSASLRGAVAAYARHGTRDQDGLSFTGVGAYVAARSDFDACVRSEGLLWLDRDPQRGSFVCLFVAPAVYETRWFNGGVLGVRVAALPW